MCGSYVIEISDVELAEIIAEVQKKFPGEKLDTSDIYPKNKAPLLMRQGAQTWWQPAIWGLPQYANKPGVIFNARAESVEEKPAFRDSFLFKRCAVPSSGFYEWTKIPPKRKYLFRLPGENLLYMAGLAKEIASSQRFVILTTAANASVAEIHHRMPVILTQDQLTAWLNDVDFARRILAGQMPALAKNVA